MNQKRARSSSEISSNSKAALNKSQEVTLGNFDSYYSAHSKLMQSTEQIKEQSPENDGNKIIHQSTLIIDQGNQG